ncbi:hypothetical protein CANINC_000602 [Pichia inconspicua]|uniref:Dipeptidyl-peptidase IV n=1 Tax=Pichia inconspicua TaxID=52247 RepID=A0A4T0X5D7_9ASCO|nr:hypothetical protein CANINC_000602 [[Candida] inconspicua]
MNLGEKESNTIHPISRTSWKFISLITIVLIYGTSILLSQINTLYTNHKNFQLIQKQQYQESQIGKSEVPQNDGKKSLTFEDVRKGIFIPDSKSIQWIQTSTSLTNDSGEYIVAEDNKYTLKSFQNENFSKILYDLGDVINYNGKDYIFEDITFSNDLKTALITCDKRHNWRHSFFASYFVFDVQERRFQLLHESENIALAKLSPDSKKVSFVLNNNVFVKDITSFENSSTTQVTFDGSAQTFYGKPDWVYEEEVFESDSALWWSPNSEQLFILKFNDSEVPTFPIPYFVQQDSSNSSSYPIVEKIKYPKAGYPNPIVDFLVYDVKNNITKKLSDSDPFYNDNEIDNVERLITEVVWVGNEQVLLRVTNRESDILKIFIVTSSENGIASTPTRFEDGRNEKSWFEITHNTIYIPKSDNRPHDGYIDRIGVNGYDHLAYFSPANSSEPKVVLTNGDWEVVDGAAAYDFVNDLVYYVSTEKSSIERHLYSVSLDGESKQNITNLDSQAWFDVSFSAGARYLLLSYRGREIPYQQLLDLHENTVFNFTTNEELRDTLANYSIPSVNYGSVELDNGVNVNFRETLPVGFDKSKKYPLLFFVYGGPGSQLVQQPFAISFSSVVASELDAVVVTIDGRGTGFKGKKFRNIVRDQLGYYEVIDQVAAAKHWISKGYIDEERTAIWGWSYGGYMTLKTLEHDQGNVFKFGMSVAPVTDWKLYDSVYTERYMHTPQHNLDGYNKSRVAEIDGFKNVKRFLLMHGTGDDNVHFQNSIQLIDSFDLHGVENYDMYVFPDSDHSIRWHNAGTIVYDRLFSWLKRAFNGEFENVNQSGAMDVDQDFFIDLYG